MKVSALFSKDKLNEEIIKVKKYNSLLGIDENITVLENDIGKPGELYDKAVFNIDRFNIEIKERKDLNVAYLSSAGISIVSDYEIKIGKCYQQKGLGYHNGRVEYNFDEIEELHIDADESNIVLFIGTEINRVVIYSGGDSCCFLGMICKINELTFDKNCKYIAGAHVVTLDEDLTKIFSKWGVHIPSGVDRAFIRINNDGKIKLGRTYELRADVSDEELLKIYRNSSMFSRYNSVELRYFGVKLCK